MCSITVEPKMKYLDWRISVWAAKSESFRPTQHPSSFKPALTSFEGIQLIQSMIKTEANKQIGLHMCALRKLKIS